MTKKIKVTITALVDDDEDHDKIARQFEHHFGNVAGEHFFDKLFVRSWEVKASPKRTTVVVHCGDCQHEMIFVNGHLFCPNCGASSAQRRIK